MPKYFKITILVLLLAFLIVPHLASAAFIKCGRECVKWSSDHSKCVTPGVNPDGTCIPMEEAQPCSICHIFQLLQTLINGFTLALIIWAIFFTMFAGFMILISSGSPEKISQAKRIMGYVVMGLLVGFGGWLFINTIMNTFVQPGALPWPWHEIKCAIPAGPPPEGVCGVGGGDGDGGTTPETQKKYCICEIPVYTVNPQTYPSVTKVLGHEIKGTELANKDECAQKCVAANAGTYCSQRELTNEATEGNFYCASQNDLQAKTTHCINIKEHITENVGGSEGCSASRQTCVNRAVPGQGSTTKEYVDKCWIDGQFVCTCTEGLATWCTSNRPYGLYRNQKEIGSGYYYNGWECIRYCGVYAGKYCRLGNPPDWGPTGNWCTRSAPAGSNNWILNPPPGGADSKQKGDASPQLTDFLNCMYGKISSLRINSISENALCANSSCDTTDTTKTCGSHNQNSCHYGGKQCTGLSYSVDFADSTSCADISTAAKECDSNPWINWEPGTHHTHITIGYGMTNCDCVDKTYGAGKSCP